MRHVSQIDAAWKRLGLTLVGIVVVLVFVTLVGWLAGMGGEFDSAQYSSAERLAQRDDWSTLRRDATLDMAVFVPAYLFAGVALAWIVLAASAPRNLVMSLLVFTALADLVETFLFRRSLTKLIDGSDADGIATATTLTHVASWLKYGALGAATLILIVAATRRDGSPLRLGRAVRSS